MRHFLHLALAPRPLARGVPTRSAATSLVALPSTPQRLAPAHRRALRRAVLIAPVTVTADAHLLCAAPAAVEPIGLLACLHTPRTQHWTTPRIAGIKAMQTCLDTREHAEGPGFFRGMCPGLRLSGVRTQDSAACLLVVWGPCASLTLITRPRSTAFDSIRSPQAARANRTRWTATSRMAGHHGCRRAGQHPCRRPNSKTFACANSAANDFGDAARQSPKSRGFITPSTGASPSR